METLFDITRIVNSAHSSKNPFLNEKIQTIIENLSDQQKLGIIETANRNRVTDTIAAILDRKEINLENDISSFLESLKSSHTRITYTHRLNVFLEYCNSQNIDPRLATYETARDFLQYLIHKGKSSVVIRQTISVLKSFYEYMLDIHELHFSNPFSHKALLPKKERIKPLVIPTQTEYDRIVEVYSKNESKKALLAALAIIRKYGVRVCAFHNSQVLNRNRVRITEYKGKEQTFVFNSIDIERLKTVVSRYKTTKALEVALIRILKKCYEQGLTDNAYSPHDFRHLFACKLYKETKDIVRVSTALNHSNLSVTDIYITALKKDGLDDFPSPSLDDYNRIITKYRTYHEMDSNIFLDALYFISRYDIRISDFHIATIEPIPPLSVPKGVHIRNTIKENNFVKIENGLSLILFNATNKEIKRLKAVVSRYKTTQSLEIALTTFLKKCHKQGLTDKTYSPNAFRRLFTVCDKIEQTQRNQGRKL
jgi:site-specific recombinase XerD